MGAPMYRTIDSATPETAGDALSTAAVDLLNYLEVNGVPSEHISDPQVLAYQRAWNADPANASDKLATDGGYGPLTQGTLNVLTGGIAPHVNTGPGPAPSPAPAPITPKPAAPIAPTSSGGHLGLFLLLGAAGLAAYLLFRKKRKGGGGHHRSHPVLEVRTNPRGRRRRNPLEGF